MERYVLLLPLALVFLLASKTGIAEEYFVDDKKDYSPYIQVGGTRFFNVKNSSSAAALDFFMPIWQQPNNLLFTDIRFYDRSGKAFEGNIHLGYRHLLPEKHQLYGIYAAFDRKRTELENYFNQLTLGGECWWNKIFLGGNFYQPIGNSSKLTGYAESANLRQTSGNLYNIWITSNERYEKAMGGVDIETGYEFTKELIGYVGGYYFSKTGIDSICGPKAKLTYDWSLGNGKKIAGIFDKLGLEAGVQNDKPRGTVWYLSANLRIGLLPSTNTKLQEVSHHMVDLVRRDVDIISLESQKSVQNIYKENGKEVTIQILPALPHTNNINLTTAPISFSQNNDSRSEIKILGPGDYLDIISPSGYRHRISMPKIELSISDFTTESSKLLNKLTQQEQAPITELQPSTTVATSEQHETVQEQEELPKETPQVQPPKSLPQDQCPFIPPAQNTTAIEKSWQTEIIPKPQEQQPELGPQPLEIPKNKSSNNSSLVPSIENPSEPIISSEDRFIDHTASTGIFESLGQILVKSMNDANLVLAFTSKDASQIITKSISDANPILGVSSVSATKILSKSAEDADIFYSTGINGVGDLFYKIPVLTSIIGTGITIATYVAPVSLFCYFTSTILRGKTLISNTKY